jgi:hypothetical protein
VTLLTEDGSIYTYEYNGNVVGLLDWMEQRIPRDIDNLSSINMEEIRDTASSQPIVVACKGEENYTHQQGSLQSPVYSQPLESSHGITPEGLSNSSLP